MYLLCLLTEFDSNAEGQGPSGSSDHVNYENILEVLPTATEDELVVPVDLKASVAAYSLVR